MKTAIMTLRKQTLNSCLFALLCVVTPTHAGDTRIIDVGGGLYNAQVTSLKELRFKNTIRQEHDFSCGSAALATLLTYHYDDPVTEEQVFTAMFDRGDKQKIEREGFSLLDMKHYLQAHGYHADGYIANLDKVAQVGIPVIVLINNGGYMHFVVIKGIDSENILIGDPATGTRTLPRSDFDAIWNNKLVFVIHDKKQTALDAFNRVADWKIREKSPLGVAVSGEGLGAYSILVSPATDGSFIKSY